MEITFLGHSCFSIKIGEVQLLIDPFISGNPEASSVDVSALKPDIILLSHGHQDHVLDAEQIAKQSNALVIANYEVANWINAKGIENVKGMNQGGTHIFETGTVKMVPAMHSSSLPDGSYGGNPLGFIIKADGETLYYAGDTGISAEMDLIGKFEQPTLAILPIGDTFTMGVNDAIICSDMIKCNRVIGMHFNTFPPIKIDVEESKRKFSATNKNLIIMNVNEVLTV